MVNLKLGDGIKWKDGAKIAVMVTFDFDAEYLRKSRNDNGVLNFADISRGLYGPNEGLKRCLKVLEDTGIKSTFFVPGKIAERYPEKIKEIAAAGHELAYHGYEHESEIGYPMEKEIENMEKSEKILEELGGKKIVGHRGCYNIIQPYTIDLLRSRGYKYSSVMKDRDWAYLHRAKEGEAPVAELPTEHTLDDVTYFYFSYCKPVNKSNYTAEYVRGIWKDYFDELLREEDKVFVLKLHPQLIGRASRAKMLKDFITYMKEQGAWIATCEEVADYVIANTKESPQGIYLPDGEQSPHRVGNHKEVCEL